MAHLFGAAATTDAGGMAVAGSVAAAHGDDNEEGDNIWVAAGDGNIERVTTIAETGGTAMLGAKDESGYTALHAAASYGHLEVRIYLFITPFGGVGVADLIIYSLSG